MTCSIGDLLRINKVLEYITSADEDSIIRCMKKLTLDDIDILEHLVDMHQDMIVRPVYNIVIGDGMVTYRIRGFEEKLFDSTITITSDGFKLNSYGRQHTYSTWAEFKEDDNDYFFT